MHIKQGPLKQITSNSTFPEEREQQRGGRNGRRTGNTNLITAAARAQVITGAKRSPASPEADEPLCFSHLCRGATLSFADCR